MNKPKILKTFKYCKIIDETDKDFLKKLDYHLSFKYEGAEFLPSVRAGKWNGVEHLLSGKLTFLTGLLDNVIRFYKEHNKEVEIIDQVPQSVPNNPIDLSDKLNELGITPFDYQEEAVNKALESDRVLYHHCTGSGKSLTSALITAKLNKKTAVLVIGTDLLYQFHKLYSLLFNQKIGIIGDGICDIQDISIVSIWSAGRAVGLNKKEILQLEDIQDENYNENDTIKILNYLKSVKVFHLDEAHICGANVFKNIYKVVQPERLFSFSGTPSRGDGSDLLLIGLLGNNVHRVTASELIKRNILAKPFIEFKYIKGKAKFSDTYHTVYSEHIVNNNYRNNIIVDETAKLTKKGYQVLVLFKTINHGRELLKKFKEHGIEPEFLSGKDNSDKRNDVKQIMLNKENNILIASQIYDIGISVETLSALVLAGGGKSSIRTLQRIGRVIRDGKNKPFAAVIDFFDDVRFLKKHSLIRKEIYETEPEFVIKFPNLEKYKKKV